MKIFHYLILYFALFSFEKSGSLEIKILAIVNNLTISNYDLFIEIKTRELLENKTINKSQNKEILLQMIDELVRVVEVKKNNISANKSDLNSKLNEILTQLPDVSKMDDQIKNNIIYKIENSIKWNNFILMKFKNKIEINTNEIEQMVKSKNLNDKEKKEIVKLEKNKKLQVFSKIYFNEIKQKYFIQIY